MISILKKLYAKLKNDVESNVLLGVSINTVKGTIQGKTDYDDAWFLALSQHSRIVFDIGCNSGYTALLALVSDPHKQILLVDANPLAMARAVKNLALNKLINNARMFIGFVSDKPDERKIFYTVGSGAAGSMFKTHAKSAGKANLSVQVDTTTLDILTRQYAMVPDFIKIDVEGAEALVLNGGRTLAGQKKSRFLVEMHGSPELSMAENTGRVLAWCKETGFSAWYMKDQVLLETENQIAHRGRCHLLLQPEGWPYPEFMTRVHQNDPLPSGLNQK